MTLGLRDFFRKVPTARPEEIREFMRTRKPGEYALVDVRTPREYRSGHLPGAQSIPLDELPGRLLEIDRETPVFVY
ncbi:MAG: rhodanese-like domain-containing protein [Candidatus Geothermincolia bacterium]